MKRIKLSLRWNRTGLAFPIAIRWMPKGTFSAKIQPGKKFIWIYVLAWCLCIVREKTPAKKKNVKTRQAIRGVGRPKK